MRSNKSLINSLTVNNYPAELVMWSGNYAELAGRDTGNYAELAGRDTGN